LKGLLEKEKKKNVIQGKKGGKTIFYKKYQPERRNCATPERKERGKFAGRGKKKRAPANGCGGKGEKGNLPKRMLST